MEEGKDWAWVGVGGTGSGPPLPDRMPSLGWAALLGLLSLFRPIAGAKALLGVRIT